VAAMAINNKSRVKRFFFIGHTLSLTTSRCRRKNRSFCIITMSFFVISGLAVAAYDTYSNFMDRLAKEALATFQLWLRRIGLSGERLKSSSVVLQ
jgi:hypothetical protein